MVSILTGYPRSGTCWMSEVMTCRGHSFCYHEAGGLDHNSMDAWLSDLGSRSEGWVIDSNSGLLVRLDWINFLLSSGGLHAVCLLKKADHDSCMISFFEIARRLLIPDDRLTSLWSQIEGGMLEIEELIKSGRIRGMIVEYDSIPSAGQCEEIAEFLAPGFPWDSARHQELRKKSITQIHDF